MALLRPLADYERIGSGLQQGPIAERRDQIDPTADVRGDRSYSGPCELFVPRGLAGITTQACQPSDRFAEYAVALATEAYVAIVQSIRQWCREAQSHTADEVA